MFWRDGEDCNFDADMAVLRDPDTDDHDQPNCFKHDEHHLHSLRATQACSGFGLEAHS